MSERDEDLELLIEDYLDERMDAGQRANFERRMAADPALRQKVETATRSVQLVQQALGWVTPGDKFDEEVGSKIVSISQSNIKPVPPAAAAGTDAAGLARENRRLLLLAVAAAILFGLAVCAGVYAITHSSPPPETQQGGQ